MSESSPGSRSTRAALQGYAAAFATRPSTLIASSAAISRSVIRRHDRSIWLYTCCFGISKTKAQLDSGKTAAPMPSRTTNLERLVFATSLRGHCLPGLPKARTMMPLQSTNPEGSLVCLWEPAALESAVVAVVNAAQHSLYATCALIREHQFRGSAVAERRVSFREPCVRQIGVLEDF